MVISEIIGHILGFCGVAAVITSYQLKTKSSIMAVQTLGAAFISVQFLLIGAIPGFALNGICFIRNIAFFFKHKLGRFENVVPYLFAGIMIVTSIFVWDHWFTVFMMLGLAINTVCLGILRPQPLRASLLLTCPMAATYDIFAGSIAGLVNEVFSIISAVVGLIRYRRSDKTLAKVSEGYRD